MNIHIDTNAYLLIIQMICIYHQIIKISKYIKIKVTHDPTIINTFPTYILGWEQC